MTDTNDMTDMTDMTNMTNMTEIQLILRVSKQTEFACPAVLDSFWAHRPPAPSLHNRPCDA